jgi:DNA gyrase subunit B
MTTLGEGTDYDCDSIEVLEGLEPIRRRPGMYVGNVHDGSGLHHLLRELVDEAVLQHLDGRCHRLTVTLHAGGAATVEDDGPGIPVEVGTGRHRAVSALEVVLTTLAQRWNGPAIVNAVCEDLVAEVRRGGRIHQQRYRRGRPVTPVEDRGAAEGTGTRITLHPDPLVFTATTFDARRMSEMFRPLAFLLPGLRVELVDERSKRRETFHGRGIHDWVASLTEGQDGFPSEPVRLRASAGGLTVDVALRWTRWSWSRVRCFANLHEVESAALGWGLAQGMKRAARGPARAALLRGWQPERLWHGLAAIVDARRPAIEPTGCCCSELSRDDTRAVQRLVCEAFAESLARHSGLFDALSALTAGS